MHRMLIAAALLAACDATPPEPAYAQLPRQPEAVAIAWRGRADPPPVRWVAGELCTAGSPFPAIRVGAVCAAGTWDGRVVTLVIMPADLGAPFSDSALAHEFMHAHLDRDEGDADTGHTGPEWPAVIGVNADLVTAGL